MPVKRRQGKKRPDTSPSPELWAYLNDIPCWEWPREWNHMLYFRWDQPFYEAELRELWEADRDAVLAEWAKTRPGELPSCAKRFDETRF